MARWDKFVELHAQGTAYHLSGWLRCIGETYGFAPILYALESKDHAIEAVLPVLLVKNFPTRPRMVSIPFSDCGGPLVGTPLHEKELLNAVKENHPHVKSVEIRGNLLEKAEWLCHNYYKHFVLNLCGDLSCIEGALDGRTVRYCVRKAKRLGVEILEDNSDRGVREFYRLNQITRKKHGVPVQPMAFFWNLHKELILKGRAFILLAVWGSKVIAASVFIKLGKTVYYKYNASDPEYLVSKAPNHLLTWYAIQKAHCEGFRFFDFGRTAPDNTGLMRYKRMWGATEAELPYHYYPTIRGASSRQESRFSYRIMTAIWRALPSIIMEKAGPTIYRHMA
jgi:hypothetical protein